MFRFSDARPSWLDFPHKFCFSWVAFNAENPFERVLIDCHSPKGVHIHLDEKGKEISISASTIEEVKSIFCQEVFIKFGIKLEGII